MDDLKRLTYLPRYYYDLQALRFVPLWIAFLAMLVYNALPGHWVAQGAAGRTLPDLGLLAVEVLWYWMTIRYYRWRFGRLEVKQNILTIGFNWWVVYYALETCFKQPWSSAPWSWRFFPWAGAFPIVVMLLLPAFDSRNPWARRVKYGLGSTMIATVATLSTLYQWDARPFIAIACLTVLALGITDHLLLMSLRTPVREDVDA